MGLVTKEKQNVDVISVKYKEKPKKCSKNKTKHPLKILNMGSTDFHPKNKQTRVQFDKKAACLSMIQSVSWCFKIGDDYNYQEHVGELAEVVDKIGDKIDSDSKKVWKIILSAVQLGLRNS